VAVSSELSEAGDFAETRFFAFANKLAKSSPAAPIDSNMTTAAKSGAIIMFFFFIIYFPFESITISSQKATTLGKMDYFLLYKERIREFI